LYPSAHRRRSIAGHEVGSSHARREGQDGAEWTGVITLIVPEPTLRVFPALLDVFPLLSCVFPKLGQAFFRAFPDFATRFLHLLQALSDTFTKSGEALAKQLPGLGPRLRSRQETDPNTQDGCQQERTGSGSATLTSFKPRIERVFAPALL
jgi:hypothetical protein